MVKMGVMVWQDGKSGKDGLKGDRGVDGQAGRDGVDGVDGISVVNANIDFDGSLVISLSDGREMNVGEVVSPTLLRRSKSSAQCLPMRQLL
jgi:hypothetical protein